MVSFCRIVVEIKIPDRTIIDDLSSKALVLNTRQKKVNAELGSLGGAP